MADRRSISNPLHTGEPTFAPMADSTSSVVYDASVDGVVINAAVGNASGVVYDAGVVGIVDNAAVYTGVVYDVDAAVAPTTSLSTPIKRCANGHVLQPSTCDNADIGDMCDEFCDIVQGDKMYRCDQCDFTLCVACYDELADC